MKSTQRFKLATVSHQTFQATNLFRGNAQSRRRLALTRKPAVTTGNVMTMEELANVKGRGWEDIDVRIPFSTFLFVRDVSC